MTPRITKGILAASLVYIVAVAAGGSYTVQTLCVTAILSGLFVAFMNRGHEKPSRALIMFFPHCRVHEPVSQDNRGMRHLRMWAGARRRVRTRVGR